MFNLNDKISILPQIGFKTAKLFDRLEIKTIKDLIYYWPFRYDDFGLPKKIKDIEIGEKANIIVEIELIQNKRSKIKRKIITEAIVNDGSGQLKIVWFNQPFLTKNLKGGDMVSLSGKIEELFGIRTLVSPQYEKIFKGRKLISTQGLIANYHLTYGLNSKIIRQALNALKPVMKTIVDPLPDEIKKRQNLLDLSQALEQIHFPNNQREIIQAKKRLSFDEVFYLQLQSRTVKENLKKQKAVGLSFKEKDIQNFVSSFPFKFTDDQKKVAWRIIQDIERNQPMSRLLEGDVGCGKTAVAAVAMYNAVLNGKNNQTVFMAPTEVLARQHFFTFKNFFSKFNIRVALFTRSWQDVNFDLEKKSKLKIKNLIKKGEINIIIGTQTLIQEDFNFKRLVLAVIDEQHRFGVKQRQALTAKTGLEKNFFPHLLSMTATPIPRSLALALYSELDLSIIKEKPLGRLPVITKIISATQRKENYNFLRAKIKEGNQLFVICPLIDESDKMELKSVKLEFEKLRTEIFSEFKVASLHGQMKSSEKEATINQFSHKKIDILVSTSVVEVGVDIPGANLMIIEGAERFGLAQLHQFRGRIGRQNQQAYCFLYTENELEKTNKRLKILAENNDGFRLAEFDLKLRGAGEIYGFVQSGFANFKLASLTDVSLIKIVQEEIEKIFENKNVLANYPLLKEKVSDWQKNLHLE